MYRHVETRVSGTQPVAGATVNATRSAAVIGVLPDLRRYARAIAGSPASGDHYLRQFLEVLLSDPNTLAVEEDVKLQCFVLFHEVCSGLGTARHAMAMAGLDPTSSQLAPLLPIARELFLLVYLGGFTVRQAARIAGIAESEAGYYLVTARLTLQRVAPRFLPRVPARSRTRACEEALEVWETEGGAVAPGMAV